MLFRTCALVMGLLFAIDASADIHVPAPPQLLANITLPRDTAIDDAPVGGISGLDYDHKRHSFVAISDDRSTLAPARFYRLSLAPDTAGQWSLQLRSVHTLRTAQNQPFARNTLDGESLRILPNGNLVWSSERDKRNVASVYLADANGRTLHHYPLPEHYRASADGDKRGIRRNRGPEGLALMPAGNRVLLAMEDTLWQDGDPASFSRGGLNRLAVMNLDNGEILDEYAWRSDPIPHFPLLPPFIHINGVTEVLWLDKERLAVVERAYSSGAGNTISVYITSLRDAKPWREGITPVPLTKKLWFTLPSETYPEIDVDNIEAISHGPRINGQATLVLASDNNFSRRQISQFLVLGWQPQSTAP